MSKRKKTFQKSGSGRSQGQLIGAAPVHSATPVWPVALLLALTAVVYLPMLQHQFTNWDDEAYVVNNALLRGPDWLGIFTEPVVSNYHPLTVLSLAFNYQISGLNPFSYLLFNGLLHLANTVLVYHFARLISGKHQWVGLFTATVFALHPMHVESVAWVSERKDLLYTLFYLLALIRYWSYLVDARREDYFWCLALFVLALLSKPAAIVLPLGLLLLDYWKQRSFRFAKVWLEKIPFLALSVFFGILTLLIQSEKALVSIEKFSLLDRFFFACYNLVAYAGYFFVPLKLSAFHPFPQPGALGWAAQAAPLAVLLVAGGIWYFRKNRALVFGALFYLANLVLVLQLITVGNTLLSERYTYVPYIGLAFALAVGIQEKISKRAWWVLPAALALAFGVLTRQRVHVWQNSETLWSDAISGYPGTPIPHSNRANYFYSQALLPANANQSKALMEKALADCNAALKTRPDHFASLDVRSIIYLQFGQYENALEDASKMVDLRPADKKGYLNRGSAYERLKRYDEALADYNRCLQIDPELADALNGRGTVLFNAKKQYREALADFERALSIKEDGGYYLNRSRCFFMLGEKSKALENARAAQRLGARVDAGYLKLLE